MTLKIEQARAALRRPTAGLETFEFDVTPGHEHETMRVRWVGREVVRPDSPIETPSSPYAILKYCVSGNGVLDWENDRWDVEAGNVFWSTARHPNTLFAARGGRMVNIGIFLAGEGALENLQRFLHTPVGAVRLRRPDVVGEIFHAITEEARDTAAHREDVCALLADVLLRRIDAQAIFPESSNRLARQAFQRCREYIEQNFVRLNTLRDVADACGVTVPYLCRLFDQFFHCSAYDHITRLKMNRAERLLLRPMVPVGEVARDVGYKDARLFARNFKAAYGKSPTEYRQLHAITPDEE